MSKANTPTWGVDTPPYMRVPQKILKNIDSLYYIVLALAIVAPFNYTPSSSAVQLKRNTSYVSSIGRKREDVPSGEDSDGEKKLFGSQTSSTMVTLV